MPADRDLVLARLDFIRNSLSIGSTHASLLRCAVQQDDVEGMMRYREALHNILELFQDLMGEIGRSLPDWRPAPAHVSQADGSSESLTPRIPHSDAHLGATGA